MKMPKRHTNLIISQASPRLLTDGPVFTCRVQNWSKEDVYLSATETNVEPEDRNGALLLGPLQTLDADILLSKLFPGVGNFGNPVYLWGMSDNKVTVSVSHADE